MMSTDHKTPTKKEFKSPTDLRAWGYGRDLLVETHTWLQEYQADPNLHPWTQQILEALRDSLVQIYEGFSKYSADDKLRRYNACIFYIRRAQVTLQMGHDLGWWLASDLIPKYDEYADIMRATASHFWHRKSDESKTKLEKADK